MQKKQQQKAAKSNTHGKKLINHCREECTIMSGANSY